MGDLLCLLKANIGIVIGPCLSEYGAKAIYFDEGVIPEKKDNWSAFPAWARRERLQHGHPCVTCHLSFHHFFFFENNFPKPHFVNKFLNSNF